MSILSCYDNLGICAKFGLTMVPKFASRFSVKDKDQYVWNTRKAENLSLLNEDSSNLVDHEPSANNAKDCSKPCKVILKMGGEIIGEKPLIGLKKSFLEMSSQNSYNSVGQKNSTPRQVDESKPFTTSSCKNLHLSKESVAMSIAEKVKTRKRGYDKNYNKCFVLKEDTNPKQHRRKVSPKVGNSKKLEESYFDEASQQPFKCHYFSEKYEIDSKPINVSDHSYCSIKTDFAKDLENVSTLPTVPISLEKESINLIDACSSNAEESLEESDRLKILQIQLDLERTALKVKDSSSKVSSSRPERELSDEEKAYLDIACKVLESDLKRVEPLTPKDERDLVSSNSPIVVIDMGDHWDVASCVEVQSAVELDEVQAPSKIHTVKIQGIPKPLLEKAGDVIETSSICSSNGPNLKSSPSLTQVPIKTKMPKESSNPKESSDHKVITESRLGKLGPISFNMEKKNTVHQGLKVSGPVKRKWDNVDSKSENSASDPKSERRIVYIGNIPSGYGKESLTERFCRFGEIEEVEMKNKGSYAFITFKSREDATKAIENGNTCIGPILKLNYGGRRHFVKEDYTDLDARVAETEELMYNSYGARAKVSRKEDDYSRLLEREKKKRGLISA